ncbi:MAG: PQQ-like beta-propeller repeat protein [Lachnospiraceae bacterium]|nr:PQQ-like beta-propeller repeat protein [Lachnospiraceae bacterium]
MLLADYQKLLETGVPTSVSATEASLFGLQSALMVDDMVLESTFSREDRITFGTGAEYTALEGVITFRGNNYRNSAVFGTADLKELKFDTKNSWTAKTGKLKKTVKSGYWTGSCWTGQPLIIRWDDETRQAMNLYKKKKAKEDLVEVIYATADGRIYFLDLEDGSKTRDTISLGFPIKGTGSLYPDGTPLYFVGAGDSMGEKCARTFVINLLTGEIIYEYGYNDVFSERTDNNHFTAFDSSPLIDVETDTLIQPGENGILYLTHLNTVYNGKTVSINPDEVIKWRYTTDRSRAEEDTYWLGMESSAVVWKGYLYIADNCGDLICLDLNTMEVVWVANTLDDTNCTPVLEEDPVTGTAYIYLSTSLHWTKDANNQGDIPIYKFNAATGEVIWQRTYPCYTVSGVSGGVQSTALLGENKLSDLVYFTIARTGGNEKGKIVALNKKTGGEVWSCDMSNYTWSSPLALYDKDGNGYVIFCDSTGNMYMVDGLTGELYDTTNLDANVEASPAAFENTIVVGTRGKEIYGIKVK